MYNDLKYLVEMNTNIYNIFNVYRFHVPIGYYTDNNKHKNDLIVRK